MFQIAARVGVGALAIALASVAAANSLATFQSTTEGWVVTGINPYNHVASDPSTTPATWSGADGLGPGALRVPDLYEWTWIQAPDSWLGDRSSAFGADILWSFKISETDGIAYPAIALRGQTMTLYHVRNSPTVGLWTGFPAHLFGEYWRVNNYESGPVATDAQLLEVLHDLRGIYILTEWHTGNDDTFVDNIEFPGSIGEPCKGDVNHDGFTNAADFNILASNFRATVTPNTNGDLNGDGVVNAPDFNILAGDFRCVADPALR